MSHIRNKILLGTTLSIVFVFALTFLGSIFILDNSFQKIERENLYDNLNRAEQGLNQVLARMSANVSDWAHWNELHQFIKDKNTKYKNDNLIPPSLIHLNLNMLMIYDLKGNLINKLAVNLENQKETLIPLEIYSYLNLKNPLLQFKDSKNVKTSMISLDHQIVLLASSPITDTSSKKSTNGILVMGTFLNSNLMNKISTTTYLNLKLFLIPEIKNNNFLFEQYQKLEKSKFTHSILNDHTISGFFMIRDIFNQPVGMIQLTHDRDIYLQGQKSIQYFLFCFIIIALCSIATLWILQKKIVVNRIEKLKKEIDSISELNNLSMRVSVEHHDELSALSTKMNELLDITESSQTDLENKIKKRTQDLQKEIVERKEIEQELTTHKEHLSYLAHYDALTDLPNRVLMNNILNKSIEQAMRMNKLLAVMFIDLDGFKKINDAFGHAAGDLLLKEVALRFKLRLRATDTIARLSGDEFLALITFIDHQEVVHHIATELLDTLKKPIVICGHEHFVSASIGISIFPIDGNSLENLQRAADMAMYRAKKLGGNTFSYYTTEMNEQLAKLIKVETALRKAIINKEFMVYFQPIYSVKREKITGVEALIRWHHPEYGLLLPSEFIHIAENCRIIDQIDAYILKNACETIFAWMKNYNIDLKLAVNFSAVQFKQRSILSTIQNILHETGFPAKNLNIEITESTLMVHVEDAILTLLELKKLGISISIDDFGTGYSCMSYLKKFPINYLKLDRSFVKDILTSQADQGISRAIISMSHDLNLEVIAEGVETVEQLNFLANLDCDYLQGYFLSKPVPAEKMLSMLVDRKTEITQ